MKKLIIFLKIFFLIFLSFTILNCKKASQKNSLDLLKVKIIKVLDGDTVVLENGEKLRYAGINTLERKTESGEPEPFAEEAYQLNKKLVEDKTLYLELSSKERDIYGRLLGELYFENGTSVSEILVKNGLALVCHYPGNAKYYEKYLPLQREALKQRKGIFSLLDQFPKKFNLVGNKNSKRFHLSNCSEVKKIKKKVFFKNLEEAFFEGYCPSKECFNFNLIKAYEE